MKFFKILLTSVMLKMTISIWNARVFQGTLLNWNWGLSLLTTKKATAIAVRACILYSLSALQTLLWWQNACGFLAAAVAKQNSSNLFKFRWLLVACLCGSSSLSFESKTPGGTSVSDLNQNVFLIGKFMAEVEKDVTREKEKALFKQFNLHSSFSLVFPS